MGRTSPLMNLPQCLQYHRESCIGRKEKKNQHNQKIDEMLHKPFKTKKQLKSELIIGECIDIRFALLLLLNETEELK